MSLYTTARAIAVALFHPFVRFELEGTENIPDTGGYLLACNHISGWDPVLLALALPVPIHFMAKIELFRIPVLGYLLGKLGAFPVDRGKGDTDAVQHAVDIVKDGGVLGIFPEGSRSKDGVFRKVKSGTVVIASRTGGDILPTAIQYGKRHFLRKHVFIKYGAVIRNEDLHIEGQNRAELRAANTILASAISDLLGAELS